MSLYVQRADGSITFGPVDDVWKSSFVIAWRCGSTAERCGAHDSLVRCPRCGGGLLSPAGHDHGDEDVQR